MKDIESIAKRRKAPVRKAKETLTIATGKCSLGAILIALSRDGLVSILIGKDRARLAEQIAQHFPRARLIENDHEAKTMLKHVIRFVETPGAALNLPLDVRGTRFQRRVWEEVLKIPPGQTSTYSEIARRIGAPRAMRAVGSACSASCFALAIPCHRVTRSDGSLSGGWSNGYHRQRLLLEREAAPAEKTKKSNTKSARKIRRNDNHRPA